MAYTFGALTDFLRWPVLAPGILGPHELFHLAVLAGLSFHWMFIRSFAARAILLSDSGELPRFSLPVHRATSFQCPLDTRI